MTNPAIEPCPKCKKQIGIQVGLRRKCGECGWDLERNLRNCVGCDGLVTLHGGEPSEARITAKAGAFGITLAVINSYTLMILAGVFGWLAFVALAYMGVLGAEWASAGYRCGTCGRAIAEALLSPEETARSREVRTRLRKRMVLLAWIAGILVVLGGLQAAAR